MGNRIPRNAKKLEVEFITRDYSKMIAEKDEFGWHGTDEEGKNWNLLVGILRNENFCKIKVLA